jgi:cytochrome o ubiquinol oxidase subunit IV
MKSFSGIFNGDKVTNLLFGVNSYIVGLVISVILTLLAYFVVSSSTDSQHAYLVIIPIILILAVLQLIAQLIFFIHLGQESSPKWNVILFVSTFAGILLVVVSSIWIMAHLNPRMIMPPTPDGM